MNRSSTCCRSSTSTGTRAATFRHRACAARCPWCKYDDPVAYHRELRLSRDREVMQVKREQGKTVPQLARHFGLSERTIHRIMERARVAAPDVDGL